MAILLAILVGVSFAVLTMWISLAGWKPRIGVPNSGRLRWTIDLMLMLVLLALIADALGASPSLAVMVVILTLAAAGAYGMQSARQLIHRGGADGGRGSNQPDARALATEARLTGTSKPLVSRSE